MVMLRLRPMPDLVVVVPGILGSRLVRDGSVIWGYRGMLRYPRTLGTRLALQRDDTAQATSLLTLPVHLPGLSKLDVYGPVVTSLKSQFEVTEGDNLVLFPYDWRKSCRVSAVDLGRKVEDSLQRWRIASGNEQAGVILICHSMGGLVARWYLDIVLRGKPVDHIRALVTIGTPYQGAPKAAGAIINGVLGWTGKTGRRLTNALREFPSVYELLPQYACVEENQESTRHLTGEALDWPSSDLFKAASDFHAELKAARLRYDLQAVVSKTQTTAHRLRLISRDRVKLIKSEETGDGTVPRDGAQPYGWQSMAAAKWIDQLHTTMHNGTDTWTQLHGIITEEWRPDMALFTGLALEVPEIIPAGTPLVVTARPISSSAQPLLRVDVTDTDTEGIADQRLLEPGHGTYTATIPGLATGMYRVRVHDPSSVGGVTPIEDLVTVL